MQRFERGVDRVVAERLEPGDQGFHTISRSVFVMTGRRRAPYRIDWQRPAAHRCRARCVTQPDPLPDHTHAHRPGHAHAHRHSHGHRSHSHRRADYDRAFAIGIGLNIAYIAAEAAAGLLAGSLALLADAGHNLSDVLGLALAWGAAVLSRRTPSHRFTYGLRSSSILAALANAIILLVVTGGLAWEAVSRFTHPAPVEGGVMAWVAGLGILVNGATALLFLRGRDRDLNIRGAFLHMLADALVSAGVGVTGIAIALTGLSRIDPMVTLLVCAVIVYGTWDLMKEAIGLALDAVPEGIDSAKVRAHLASGTGGRGNTRSAYLGDEHDRDRADLSFVDAAGTPRRCDADADRARPRAPFRHSPRDTTDRAWRQRRDLCSDPGNCCLILSRRADFLLAVSRPE